MDVAEYILDKLDKEKEKQCRSCMNFKSSICLIYGEKLQFKCEIFDHIYNYYDLEYEELPGQMSFDDFLLDDQE